VLTLNPQFVISPIVISSTKTDTRKVVLLTGAGGGIGLALLKKLASNPNLITVATARPHSIKSLVAAGFRDSDHLLIRPLDVLSGNSRRLLVRELHAKFGRIDVLINNAGISFRSTLEDMQGSEEELQMATNYFGPLGLIREVLPNMRQRKTGQIINVSSVGGMMAMPTMGSYSASKFALEGASEALWYELKPWGISVSLVQPGFINSASFKKVYRSSQSKEHSPYEKYYSNMESFISKLMTSTFATSDSVADKIYKLVLKGQGQLRVPATLDAHIFSVLRRVLPREIYHKLLFKSLPKINEWVGQQEVVEEEKIYQEAV
jgi:short-subunit dehydrogenase